MFGPQILARFLAHPGTPDQYDNVWQYHSRSDRHSKVGCWGVALDLLATSTLMRHHAAQGKIVLGVNHKMTDFATGRQKALDLVLARPAEYGSRLRNPVTFSDLAARYEIPLNSEELGVLREIPALEVGATGAVLAALEAKACMTAHIKALPRLYDELNSSHLCVHGASRQALAIGYVQVNAAEEFISSDRNKRPLSDGDATVNLHNQPNDTSRVIAKISEIPRRSVSSESGFDGLGVTLFDFRNDGGPVTLVEEPPAPPPGSPFHYSSMIVRMANEYDTIFARI